MKNKNSLNIGLLWNKISKKGITTPLVHSVIQNANHVVLEVDQFLMNIDSSQLISELRLFPSRVSLPFPTRLPPPIPGGINARRTPPPLPPRPQRLQTTRIVNEFINHLMEHSNQYPMIQKIKNYCYGMLKNCDGMILPGGEDIESYVYNIQSKSLSEIITSDPSRTILELFIINRCVTLGIPLLGICRGCQIINIYFGGTLKNIYGENDDCEKQINMISAGDTRHKIFGLKSNSIEGVSLHNQCIELLGNHLTATSLSPRGDHILVYKSIESKMGSLVLGVQFHPEYYIDEDFDHLSRFIRKNKYIFDYFFKTCGTYRNKKLLNAEILA